MMTETMIPGLHRGLLFAALAVACSSSSPSGANSPLGGAAGSSGQLGGSGGASASGAGGPNVSGGASGGGNAGGGMNASGGVNASGGMNASGGVNASGGGVNPGGGSAGSSGGGASAAGLRWVGRVDASNPAAVKLAWSGTGFVATVSGTKISVSLQAESSAAFFQPVIDGAPGQRFQVATGAAQTFVLGDNLASGEHRVELYRDSEGMYGDSIFLGFVDGTVGAPPPAPGRLIEIIGDSISAGYGNLGVEVHPPWDNTCTFSLDTEAAYQAYSWQLARLLKADVSIIARSGWGMYRDASGATSGVLSSIYANTLGTQPTPAWSFSAQPDAVLINLGTNDSATDDPGQPYEDAYVAFLGTVRSHYPQAWIFLTIGPMTSDPLLTAMRTHLTNVIATRADAKVIKVDIPTQDATSTGCDYHPNVPEDQKMAMALATALATQLGW
jgi:lysophospholipase L1-like esterase